MSSSIETPLCEKPVIFLGCVKWFNNKVGYGFITLVDPHTNVEKDVFVHHSALRVAAEQYRYLVQGEYVDFLLVKSVDNSSHEYCAGQVSGVNGGKLMCETRNEYTQQNSQTQNDKKPYQYKNATYQRPGGPDNRPRTKKPVYDDYKPSSASTPRER